MPRSLIRSPNRYIPTNMTLFMVVLRPIARNLRNCRNSDFGCLRISTARLKSFTINGNNAIDQLTKFTNLALALAPGAMLKRFVMCSSRTIYSDTLREISMLEFWSVLIVW